MAWTELRLPRVLGALAAALSLAGCSHISYYLQSTGGQMEIVRARQPIPSVIANPRTPPELRARLALVLQIRDFASRELSLPDNGSYRGYADLKREYVVWNVFAADEFSMEPKTWCFPVAGCVGYRGYFSRDEAEAFARGQGARGLETYVAGVPAYSTLGWFDDPVLNTFINYPEHELARLIFHELAHQVVYVGNDSEFNESFAVTVELEGVRRWIAARGDAGMAADFERAQRRREQFIDLVLKYRAELSALYRGRLAPDAMRERKTALFAAMQQDYRSLKAEWRGYAGYDRFFSNANNATLASVAIYHALVPQFQQLLARHRGDMVAFYTEVKRLAAMGRDERAKILAAIDERR